MVLIEHCHGCWEFAVPYIEADFDVHILLLFDAFGHKNFEIIELTVREVEAIKRDCLAFSMVDATKTDNELPVVPWNQKELTKAIKKQSEDR